jgi:hypothetical protein
MDLLGRTEVDLFGRTGLDRLGRTGPAQITPPGWTAELRVDLIARAVTPGQGAGTDAAQPVVRGEAFRLER